MVKDKQKRVSHSHASHHVIFMVYWRCKHLKQFFHFCFVLILNLELLDVSNKFENMKVEIENNLDKK